MATTHPSIHPAAAERLFVTTLGGKQTVMWQLQQPILSCSIGLAPGESIKMAAIESYRAEEHILRKPWQPQWFPLFSERTTKKAHVGSPAREGSQGWKGLHPLPEPVLPLAHLPPPPFFHTTVFKLAVLSQRVFSWLLYLQCVFNITTFATKAG